ncbi:MAG: hypothetical protein ACK5LJ_05545, partial [Paracoccus sp. (in: a-proteobacteria)]
MQRHPASSTPVHCRAEAADNGGSGFGAASCLIPRFDGAILSLEWKDALWDKFVTAAPRPRTLSEQQY